MLNPVTIRNNVIIVVNLKLPLKMHPDFESIYDNLHKIKGQILQGGRGHWAVHHTSLHVAFQPFNYNFLYGFWNNDSYNNKH